MFAAQEEEEEERGKEKGGGGEGNLRNINLSFNHIHLQGCLLHKYICSSAPQTQSEDTCALPGWDLLVLEAPLFLLEPQGAVAAAAVVVVDDERTSAAAGMGLQPVDQHNHHSQPSANKSNSKLLYVEK